MEIFFLKAGSINWLLLYTKFELIPFPKQKYMGWIFTLIILHTSKYSTPLTEHALPFFILSLSVSVFFSHSLTLFHFILFSHFLFTPFSILFLLFLVFYVVFH